MRKPPVFIPATCGKCGQKYEARNGALLRFLRLERGIGLRELARRLHFSAAYLSDLERNRREPTLAIWRAYHAL